MSGTEMGAHSYDQILAYVQDCAAKKGTSTRTNRVQVILSLPGDYLQVEVEDEDLCSFCGVLESLYTKNVNVGELFSGRLVIESQKVDSEHDVVIRKYKVTPSTMASVDDFAILVRDVIDASRLASRVGQQGSNASEAARH